MLPKREMAIEILKVKYNTKSFDENAIWKSRINRMMKKSKEELIYAYAYAIKINLKRRKK